MPALDILVTFGIGAIAAVVGILTGCIATNSPSWRTIGFCSASSAASIAFLLSAIHQSGHVKEASCYLIGLIAGLPVGMLLHVLDGRFYGAFSQLDRQFSGGINEMDR